MIPGAHRLLVAALVAAATTPEGTRATLLGTQSREQAEAWQDYNQDNHQLLHDSGPEALGIIRARGFIGELYTIMSRDRQPISMYHVINPLADPLRLNKYPVLVWHGISGDSAQMISHSELARPRRPEPGRLTVDPSDTALAFMLANNNFDVWLADARGTNLNNHKVSDDLNFQQGNKYWNFSLDEQIHNDVPAVLDFVLEQTHEDKLHYIGFSQSTTFIFAFLTKFPHYQAKMASLVVLAPVAFVGHARGPVPAFFAPASLIPDSVNANYIPQPVGDTLGATIRQVCQVKPVTELVCQRVADAIAGMGSNTQSMGFFATTMKSTSVKAIKHYLQLFKHGRFGMYDYGRAGNLRQYGTGRPPDYDLSRIRLPSLIVFRGANDFLADPADQQLLLSKLGTRPYLDVNLAQYNHLDFIMARDIVQQVNLPAVEAMFHWLLVHTERDASSPAGILRDARKLWLARVRPDAIVWPNGDKNLDLRSNLVGHLLTGLSELGVGQSPLGGGAAAAKKLTRLGDNVDQLNSRLTSVVLPNFI